MSPSRPRHVPVTALQDPALEPGAAGRPLAAAAAASFALFLDRARHLPAAPARLLSVSAADYCVCLCVFKSCGAGLVGVNVAKRRADGAIAQERRVECEEYGNLKRNSEK